MRRVVALKYVRALYDCARIYSTNLAYVQRVKINIVYIIIVQNFTAHNMFLYRILDCCKYKDNQAYTRKI